MPHAGRAARRRVEISFVQFAGSAADAGEQLLRFGDAVIVAHSLGHVVELDVLQNGPNGTPYGVQAYGIVESS